MPRHVDVNYMGAKYDPMKVTIGITCFNAGDRIEKAINSALSQTWRDIEVIVIDDSSEDNSWGIISAIKDSKIRCYRNDRNYGAAYSRNKVLEYATGGTICFIDDDDRSCKTRIEMQFNCLVSQGYLHNHHMINVCSMKRNYGSGRSRVLKALGVKARPPSGEEYVDYVLYNKVSRGVDYGSGISTACMMSSLYSMKEAGGFDEDLKRVEDVDLIIRMCLTGANICGENTVLIEQECTAGERKSPFVNYISEVTLVEKYKIYLSERRRYAYARASTRLRYLYFSRQLLPLLAYCIYMSARWPHVFAGKFIRSSFQRSKVELTRLGIAFRC